MIYLNQFDCIVFGGLILFLFSPVLQAEPNEKIRQIEETILDYYRYTNGFIWRWNLEEVKLASIPGTSESAKYGTLCPRRTTLTKIKDPVVRGIVLVSQNCARVPMDMLECTCTRIEVDENGFETITNLYPELTRGPNGEVYKLSNSSTPCEYVAMQIITSCVHDGNFFIYDESEIGNLFVHGNNQPIHGSRMWTSPEITCQLLHPDTSKMELNLTTVTLESNECVQFPMLVLKCICQRNDMTNGSPYEDSYSYVKDLYNAVYEVKNLDLGSKCNKPDGLTIGKRIIDSHNRLVQPVCL